jgi:hypothetical protein
MEIKGYLVILGLSLGPCLGYGQVKIHNNSVFKSQGVISTGFTIINSSPNVDMSETELKLLNSGDQSANTAQPIIVKILQVDEGGIKTLAGNWEITGLLSLVNGVLKPDCYTQEQKPSKEMKVHMLTVSYSGKVQGS